MNPPGSRDVSEKTIDALERLSVAYRTFAQQAATAQGLSQLQVQLLAALAAGPPPAPSVDALRRELQLSQPTVSDAVASLIAKGLITRRPDPSDRRRQRLVPTDAGHKVAKAIAADRQQLISAVDHLPPADRDRILESLLTLIAELHRENIITIARTCLTCRFHRSNTETHHCDLLEMPLTPADLRVNCPEHQS
ncbi:MarR family transcriptional regulator [Nocardia sp. NPDC052566]|uniref:MarR family transcriptional regulator n=1 Tax=Nocardia sp. NPDC052566 TaxID=3364330 RepID=UPI0037C778E5